MAEDYQKTIGDRIRRIRRDRQMTQLDLARQVGVTNGQISTIERGLSAPSIGTLRRISTALAVPLIDFFESAPSRDVVILRSGERQRVTNPMGPELVDLLVDSQGLRAVQVELGPDQECARNSTRENANGLFFVLRGHLELGFSGQKHLLRTGDCIEISGRHKFAMKNVGDDSATVLEVWALAGRG